ncbi:YckD family protein [Psychrobacillus sp. INOP01]|uniref:YckD family protein n=1 Tax=Psychrobacillus sp. INOP01 TaxID=2829187 RepID=UPI001BA6C8CE|nr:YckD family protein [Psychrobacillus sp. INOP01]QUG42941.1 YckD family protein [Psychrobacillus sp. INOP01]
MSKRWFSVFTAILMTVGIMGLSLEAKADMPTDVKLTTEQQEEIKSLQQDALKQKKEIINKYVEYGVFSKEKGQKIITHLEERYIKLEQNGFVPIFHDDYKKHRSKES